jgi:hypothetical protein
MCVQREESYNLCSSPVGDSRSVRQVRYFLGVVEQSYQHVVVDLEVRSNPFLQNNPAISTCAKCATGNQSIASLEQWL